MAIADPASVSDSFPAPVPPCESVGAARDRRLREAVSVAVVGIVARLLIIAVEFTAFVWTRSSVLLVDAVASLFDVLASAVLIAAIRFAARPPDDDHPFGHGRAEPLAGFQLGVLLSGAGVWLLWRNAQLLIEATEVASIPVWTWVIPTGATALLFTVAWRIREVGRRTGSTALQAEAVHFQIDGWTSLLAAGTLLIAACWPESSGRVDLWGGGLLAVLVISLGARAATENVHQILDRAPHPDDFDRVRKSALAVGGVIDVEKVRIQHAGPDAHVDIDVEVDPLITVADSHLIAQQVRARIQTDWPFVREVVVHIEPFYEGDH